MRVRVPKCAWVSDRQDRARRRDGRTSLRAARKGAVGNPPAGHPDATSTGMSTRRTRNEAPGAARRRAWAIGLVAAGLAVTAVVAALVGLGAVSLSHGLSGAGHPRRSGAQRAARAPTAARSTGSTHAEGAGPPHRPIPRRVSLTLDAHRSGRPVPAGFFGLSLEYPALAANEEHLGTFERILTMLHPRGTGAMRLRIGGDSSQVTFLARRHHRLAPWAFAVDGRFIRRTAALIRSRGLRMIFDLNQVTATPAQSAALARRLLAGLPRHSVAGFELGNEPDSPHPALWRPVVADTPSLAAHVTAAIGPAEYDARYRADARALARLDRHVFLAGPALGEPLLDRRYIVSLLHSPHPRLGAITVHEYPYSACDSPRQADYPTIARLLSARAVDVMDSDIAPEVRLARAARLPLRVTEFNSVTCGGRPGVSDRFVTALWAPGALLELLRSGARSADLHVHEGAPNAPWGWAASRLVAPPLLYGMALFARALGPGARPIATHGSAARDPWLGAWALRLRSGAEHVVLVNRGPRPVTVHLTAARARRASVQRLSSTGLAAASATLDGQRIGGDGRWQGRRHVEHGGRLHGRLTVTLPADSAALVTLTGARRHRR